MGSHDGSDILVAVDSVYQRYTTPSERDTNSARGPSGVRGVLRRRSTVQVRALSAVSLVARAGEAIGIVGLNGSGKSTLLRIVAGLERPTRGRVLATSTPVLLGVNAALIPDLTGRENVWLGCLAMGLTPERAAEIYPDIVDLSGIGAAIQHPMRTYSSGMASRLRFAIAAAAEPDILLIDEALATGDAAFKERSEQRMAQLRQNAGCVFLVSHAAKTVEEMCTRAIWLHLGRVVTDGDAYEVAQRYRWWAWNVAKGEDEKAAGLLADAFREGLDTKVRAAAPPPASSVPRHAHRRRAALPARRKGTTR